MIKKILILILIVAISGTGLTLVEIEPSFEYGIFYLKPKILKPCLSEGECNIETPVPDAKIISFSS